MDQQEEKQIEAYFSAGQACNAVIVGAIVVGIVVYVIVIVGFLSCIPAYVAKFMGIL